MNRYQPAGPAQWSKQRRELSKRV
uniref:Uncharacterized protein n=1 Tax=Rhizophora mucronata TaxID=61149 RepID=A0A2P2NDK3_RHIMU